MRSRVPKVLKANCQTRSRSTNVYHSVVTSSSAVVYAEKRKVQYQRRNYVTMIAASNMRRENRERAWESPQNESARASRKTTRPWFCARRESFWRVFLRTLQLEIRDSTAVRSLLTSVSGQKVTHQSNSKENLNIPVETILERQSSFLPNLFWEDEQALCMTSWLNSLKNDLYNFEMSSFFLYCNRVCRKGPLDHVFCYPGSWSC